MPPTVKTRLEQIRKSRGVSASQLAQLVNVSRQTIYAIEAGAYVPNTEVALLLARELEVSVDELFSLSASAKADPEKLSAEVLSVDPPPRGQPVRICQVGERWVGVPVSASPYYIPEADGVVETSSAAVSDLVVFAKEEASQKGLVLAGCDPATSLLSSMVEKTSGVKSVSAAAASRLALQWLKQGKVHIAGSHLEDPKTGEFNLPYVRKQFPKEDICIVTFARWEEGFVVAPGNPKKIKTVAHLTQKNVTFVNRELGSGSRALLDSLLSNDGIEPAKIRGYTRVAYGHLAAAYTVMSREADACLATRSAAQVFGLDFVPLRAERYDLVMHRGTTELPAVKVFLDILQRAALRRKLEVLAGYDTSETGKFIA